MELGTSAPGSARSGESRQTDPDIPVVRRRRKKQELTLFDDHVVEDVDNTWYLYIPGLVGAGTALLAVGIIGVLSFSTWSRRNQGS
jgi:thiamine pyrophosphokinase